MTRFSFLPHRTQRNPWPPVQGTRDNTKLRRLLPAPPDNLCSNARHLTDFTKGKILPTYIIRTKQIIFKQTSFSSSQTWLSSHFTNVDLL